MLRRRRQQQPSSLIVGGIKAGMAVRIACPAGYLPDATLMDWARKTGVSTVGDVLGMAKGADVVYTKRVGLHGPGRRGAEEAPRRLCRLPNQAVMDVANAGAMVHCLPAHRGEEITAEVLEAHADGKFRGSGKPPPRTEGRAGSVAGLKTGIRKGLRGSLMNHAAFWLLSTLELSQHDAATSSRTQPSASRSQHRPAAPIR